MPRTSMPPEEKRKRRRLSREKWRAANPEKDVAAKRAWALANRDTILAKARAAYAAKKQTKPALTEEDLALREALRLQKKREYQKAYRKKYPERVADTRKRTTAKHAVKRNAEKAAWAKKNAPRVRAWTRQRQAAQVCRTPAWLTADDLWMLEQAYVLAQQRTQMFGFSWHVDHVIPLRGKKVSGLHVPTNVQVIPGAENSRKSNCMEVA